jgi:NAD(P)-dependent dehydrogenase (short-subunit alcohol dehydrogenase family)
VTGSFEGRVAIVTGASRGIGESIARRFAAAGARVVLSARTLEPTPGQSGSLMETVESIRSKGGTAEAVRCDVSKAEDRRRLVAESNRLFGSVDVLVNNAAVTYLLPIEQFPEKRFGLMVAVQLWAPIELTQLVLPGMRANRAGWILNITSRSASYPIGPPFEEIQARGHMSVYGTMKAGLDRLTTALASELAPSGIAVNALAPWDNVATPGAGHHALVEGYRLEPPEMMAEAALALCSSDPRRLTGRIAYSQPLLAELQRRPLAV